MSLSWCSILHYANNGSVDVQAELTWKMYDFKIWSWSKQWEILFAVISNSYLGCCYLKVWSLFSARNFKNMMNNYAWTLIIWWKRKIFIYFMKCYNLWCVKIYFSFSFCSDFNLKATVVKTCKIRGLKQ